MNRFSTCAWIDTSSAATDSSQTRNSGFTARARAMPMRARCPPENWCGKRRISVGSSPTRFNCRSDVLDLLFPSDDAVCDGRLADDVDDAHPRVERRVGILEDHLHLELLLARRLALEMRQRQAAPVALARGERQQSDGETAERRLAAAGLADEADHLARQDREIDVVDRAHDLLRHPRPQQVADPRGRVERSHESLRHAAELDQARAGNAGRGRPARDRRHAWPARSGW